MGGGPRSVTYFWGGGVQDLWQFVTGGGQKSSKKAVTYFMDGPLNEHQIIRSSVINSGTRVKCWFADSLICWLWWVKCWLENADYPCWLVGKMLIGEMLISKIKSIKIVGVLLGRGLDCFKGLGCYLNWLLSFPEPGCRFCWSTGSPQNLDDPFLNTPFVWIV